MTTCVEKIVPVVQAEDRFRNVDRGVKQLIKSTQQQVDKSKKRSWTDHNDSTIENSFSWSDVVDPLSSSSRLRYIRSIPGCLCTEPHRCTSSAQGTKVFELEGYPSGLYVFMNAICSEGQLIWARRALEVYSTAEHTNLSNLSKLQENGDKDMRDANETTNQLWENSIRAKDNFASFNKLRWSCLGYHYDWSNRMYQRDLKTPFPEDLTELCQNIAAQVDKSLVPEAAIVNFYPLGTCMGGHLDDAEHTLEHPIVSISLGSSAVFMMGGRTKDVPPHALFLRSGDAVIMSGESRFCYHGVPAIVSEEVEERLTGMKTRIHHFVDENSSKEWDDHTKTILQYLRSHRINMNVRQVRVDVTSNDWVDKTGTGYVKYALS